MRWTKQMMGRQYILAQSPLRITYNPDLLLHLFYLNLGGNFSRELPTKTMSGSWLDKPPVQIPWLQNWNLCLPHSEEVAVILSTYKLYMIVTDDIREVIKLTAQPGVISASFRFAQTHRPVLFHLGFQYKVVIVLLMCSRPPTGNHTGSKKKPNK